MRGPQGAVPTDAGLAFWRQAQLALRHADEARRAAQQGHLSGTVSVGLAPTTASVLAAPFMAAMRKRYPQIHLHLVESLSGHLSDMLRSRQLDLAILFVSETVGGLSVTPLLAERLFVIGAIDLPDMPKGGQIRLARLGQLPLLMPSAPHGLRAIVDAAFARANCQPNVIADIDGLATLMEQVHAGVAATIQPGAAVSRRSDVGLRLIRVTDTGARRPNVLAGLSDDELSPAALATRIVLVEVVRRLVNDKEWIGATLHDS